MKFILSSSKPLNLNNMLQIFLLGDKNEAPSKLRERRRQLYFVRESIYINIITETNFS
jgi:hypothetical protein